MMNHRIARMFVAVVTLAASAGVGWAQLPPPGDAFQFDITGYLQEATLNGGGAAGPLAGGLLKVNGHLITVPQNTIVIFPANQLTWQETFAQAPAPYGTSGNGQSGLALADTPAPLTGYEAHVQGNVVNGVWIAGTVQLAQQGLNSGQGYITAIDYVLGEMQIANSAGTPVRVQINDPFGRFGRVVTSPDRRFVVDPDNPTIASATGYPMCLPRTNPAISDDAFCPQGNRPKSGSVFLGTFTTNNLTNPNFPASPGVFPDSTKQAPFEIGDYVTYAGTL